MLMRFVIFITTLVFPCLDAWILPVAPASNLARANSHPLPLPPIHNFHLCATDDSAHEFQLDSSHKKESSQTSPLEWVSLGMSSIYLAHFASLYTQLPGLFGPTGLLPVSERIAGINDVWALNLLSSPELGLELFATMGIVVSAAQIVFSNLRYGFAGVVTFGLQWILWHDLVIAGGRFMAYQMDLLLLDAAPLTLLAASGLSPVASSFGYRWLLSRLYIGAGAVKLLSCDASWRDLSAVHTHFQSQPLPNPVGAAAYLHLPDEVGRAITLSVLVVEMAAPFLFLTPSSSIRRVAFVLHVLLMVGIALFGNFGPLQAILIVIGFALLDEPVSERAKDNANVSRSQSTELKKEAEKIDSVSVTGWNESDFSSAINVVSLCIAAWATLWTIHNIGARCIETFAVEPLVFGLTAVGAASCMFSSFVC